jgi:ribose transport system ATP-binding protein
MAAANASSSVLLSIRDIQKRFTAVIALKSISFDVRAGEVHALMGENGAGKSTLMKILAGEVAPSGGEIEVSGIVLRSLDPVAAKKLGIGLVHQELSLVPALTVAENIYLGQLPRRGLSGSIDWNRAHADAGEALQKLGVEIPTNAEIRSLEVAEQQLVEIARVLEADPKIILFDEPTSALSDNERSRLFEVIQRLRATGHGIIYISHHLSEIMEIADRVTVLRDGIVAASLPIEEVTEEEVIALMIGRSVVGHGREGRHESGEVALEVKDLSAGRTLRGVSFSVRRGEILGVFGLMGAGQADLGDALFGLSPNREGQIAVGSNVLSSNAPAEAIKFGMGLLSRDRRRSVVPMQPIGPNLSLAWLSDRPMASLLERARETAESRRYIESLKVRPESLTQKLLFFSGGNQQKILLARWMSSKATILILDEPTRGVDVAAKAEIFSIITKLVNDGAAVVMISSEINELIKMSDRVVVLNGGRINKELNRGEISEESLLTYANARSEA